jgi:hypothetical protein
VLDDGAPFDGQEDYVARRLGRLLQVGLEHCRALAGTAVNYAELPEAMAGRLAGFFRLDIEQRGQAFSAVSQHAKQPTQAFAGDSEDKRQEASPLLRDRVERWAQAPYQSLELLRMVEAKTKDSMSSPKD